MKETFEVSKEQIKEAYDASCPAWQRKIRNWFPEAFSATLKVGNWYRRYIGKDFYILILWSGNFGNDSQKGFDGEGNWRETLGIYEDSHVEVAPEEEVISHLVTEYTKRGFKKGAKFKCVAFPDETHTVESDSPIFWNLERVNSTDINRYNITGHNKSGGVVYKQGQWAQIVAPVVEDNSGLMKETIPSQEEIVRVLDYLESLKPLHSLKVKEN